MVAGFQELGKGLSYPGKSSLLYSIGYSQTHQGLMGEDSISCWRNDKVWGRGEEVESFSGHSLSLENTVGYNSIDKTKATIVSQNETSGKVKLYIVCLFMEKECFTLSYWNLII